MHAPSVENVDPVSAERMFLQKIGRLNARCHPTQKYFHYGPSRRWWGMGVVSASCAEMLREKIQNRSYYLKLKAEALIARQKLNYPLGRCQPLKLS